MSTARQHTRSRDRILSKIRQAKSGDGPSEALRRKAVDQRLGNHPRGLIPKRGQQDRERRVALLIEQIEKVAATTSRVNSRDDVPPAISDYLKRHNLPAEILIGKDQRLSTMSWTQNPSLIVRNGPARADDLTGVAYAMSGVAETGTLILTSGADNPTTNNFLPAHHIVVIDADTIDPSYEDGFDRLANRHGSRQMPRVVNFISGPSRSADIEQVIYYGAHGPKTLHVIVVGA